MYNPAAAATSNYMQKKRKEKKEREEQEYKERRKKELQQQELRKEELRVQQQQKNQDDLCKAAGNGSSSEVSQLLKANIIGIDVPGGGWNIPPLWIAAHEKHYDIVTMLIQAGANVDYCAKKDGVTLLMVAARDDNDTLIELLLKHKAQINLLDKNGFSALSHAIMQNAIRSVKILIRYKADLKAECIKIALCSSISKGHLEMAKLLISSDVNYWNKIRGLITCALNEKDINCLSTFVKALNNKVYLNQITTAFGTLLKSAVEFGGLEIVKYLLENGADVNGKAKYSSDGAIPLHVAAEKNHLNILNVLIQYKADIDAQNKHGATPIFCAAQEGNYEVVERLLLENANIEIANMHGETPLHRAIRWGQEKVVVLLLETRKYLINRKTKSGDTPLHLAVQCNKTSNIAIAEFLINNGANVNELNDAKFGAMLTPLHYVSDACPAMFDLLVRSGAKLKVEGMSKPLLFNAISQGSTEIPKKLLGLNVDVNEVSHGNISPLMIASEKNNIVVMELLIQRGANVHLQSTKKMTALAYAALNNKIEAASLLLKHKAEINVDCSPLFYALKEGHIEMAKLLIQAGADISHEYIKELIASSIQKGESKVLNCFIQSIGDKHILDRYQISEGNTLLNYAVACNQSSIVVLFLKAGIDVNGTSDELQRTALHIACEKNYLKIIMILIDHKANMNAVNKFSETPLHYACTLNYVEIVEYLLLQGANLWYGDVKSQYPIDCALLKKCKTAIDFFIDYNSKNNNNIFFAACENNAFNILNLFFERQPELIKVKDKSGGNMLHFAITLDSPKLMKYFLYKGIDINSVDPLGFSPLHASIRENKLKSFTCLVEKGANLTLQTKNEGWYPVHLAAMNPDPSFLGVVVKNNCPLEVKDNGKTGQYATPFHYVAKLGHESSALLLIGAKADINSRDSSGATPLHWAVQNSQFKMIKLLVANGANINAITNKAFYAYGSETPLHWAIRFTNSDELISLLLELGANKNVMDSQWKSPLDRAKGSGKSNLAAVLKNPSTNNVLAYDSTSEASDAKPFRK